ncbi:MAG: ABC transporter permease [Clostridia bacterium]|nr:ABC transporter permease [Clostridia bacterium]
MKKMFFGVYRFFAMLLENVRMSVSNIFNNRLRSFLTILGIMIGVTAVIALITTISAVSRSISNSFTSMGAGQLTLSVSGSDLKPGLNTENLNALLEVDGIVGLTPSVSLSASMIYGGERDTGISVKGVNEYYFTREDELVERGRTINIFDVERKSAVCLIGKDVLESFFYGVNPLEKTVYLNGIAFTVIGILGEDATNDVMIPYTTALKMNAEAFVTSATLYLTSAEISDSVVSSLEPVLDEMFSFEEDTYSISTMEALENTMTELLGMMSALLAGIASIALIVGGIGIMNMMLTSVTERTGEIGLKKALGARPGEIQMQFLIESFLLSMMGGVLGVGQGVILSIVMCRLMGADFSLSYGSIALGVGFSAAVGIIFGWSPARKASRLNPIDALRSM